MLAWHLVPVAAWSEAASDAPFSAASLDDEGFVHLTHDEEELLRAGDRYYRDDPRPYVALLIDLDRLSAPWRYDGDERFPHAYGPLDREAILAVRAVTRGPDGAFKGVAAS